MTMQQLLEPGTPGSPPFPSDRSPWSLAPSHALEHALALIRRKETAVQAWALLADPGTLPAPEERSGPLAGIPFGVKDVIDVAGLPTRCGSPASDDRPALFHAASVDMLVNAGAIPLGKTVTAEYAFRHPGPTRNPWNPAHTPGGSSSGSAAAVAAGMVPFALSTQTGGSIIRPAAYCGVPGFKPSYGALSREGMQLTSESLDTLGWHAADMDWVERCADILLPAAPATPARPLEQCRIAIIDMSPEAVLEPEGRMAMDQAVDALRRAGADCVAHDASRELEMLARAHTAIMKYEFARNLAPVARARPDGLTPSLLQNVEEGWNVPSPLYREMCALQHEMRTHWKALSGGADYILTPPAAGPAPAGHAFTGAPAFNKCWTVLGWPCLHIPVRNGAGGLPTGVQLIGPWNEDFSLISLGKQLEALLAQTQP
ncbi:amidase [Paracandidimonas soli]|uniref:amidase n=1 Tax=Paracandidimonas soli TaxID=1917182 RepID=UPI00333EAA09